MVQFPEELIPKATDVDEPTVFYNIAIVRRQSLIQDLLGYREDEVAICFDGANVVVKLELFAHICPKYFEL